MTERDIAARLIGVLEAIASAPYHHAVSGPANFERLQDFAAYEAAVTRDRLADLEERKELTDEAD